MISPMSDIRIGIIGGTGLGEALLGDMQAGATEAHTIETPFGPTSSPVLTGSFGEARIALLQRHGAGHVLNPRAVPYRANIFALKTLGVTHLIASGATGSLRDDVHPGELVLCDQLIDKTEGRPRTFYEHAAVHVEFSEPCCPVMRRWLLHAAQLVDDVNIHTNGTYVCMEGPAFSTRAESELHRNWGADLIGMTALPEAKLAREAEIAYALVALPTDYDCWKPHDPTGDSVSLLKEIMGNLQHATEASVKLIRRALEDVSILREQASPAHDALALAIWSDKKFIDPGEVRRLGPLWGRHFDE